MKTVLAFGTFDVFHPGHHYFLAEAKKHGDRLVVIVARDGNVQRIKGTLPHDNEHKRLEHVQAFSAVDEARLGYEEWGKHLQVLQDVQPDVICVGYDQRADLPPGSWTVVQIPPYHPDQYKSSLLKQNRA